MIGASESAFVRAYCGVPGAAPKNRFMFSWGVPGARPEEVDDFAAVPARSCRIRFGVPVRALYTMGAHYKNTYMYIARTDTFSMTVRENIILSTFGSLYVDVCTYLHMYTYVCTYMQIQSYFIYRTHDVTACVKMSSLRDLERGNVRIGGVSISRRRRHCLKLVCMYIPVHECV